MSFGCRISLWRPERSASPFLTSRMLSHSTCTPWQWSLPCRWRKHQFVQKTRRCWWWLSLVDSWTSRWARPVPVNQWQPLVKARAAEQAAEVAKAAAMARQAAFEEHQRAIQEKEALANADAAVEVLASQERAVFVAAARLWHSELVGPCCLELEKAKAALMAGKQAREAQVCATSAKAMSYEAGLRNGQLPRDFMATQSASYFFYGFDMFLWFFWVASPSSTTSIFL